MECPRSGVRRLRVTATDRARDVVDVLWAGASASGLQEALAGYSADQLRFTVWSPRCSSSDLASQIPSSWVVLDRSPLLSKRREAPEAAVPRHVRQDALRMFDGVGIRAGRKKLRKDLIRHLRREQRTLLLELFSTPRVSVEMVRRGYQASHAIDLRT
eukprot:7153180-Pyramimonas_sp.AAC.1